MFFGHFYSRFVVPTFKVCKHKPKFISRVLSASDAAVARFTLRDTLTVAGLILIGIIGVASCGISKWSLVSSDSRMHAMTFSSMFFADSDNGLALTVAELVATTDGGKTWTNRFAGGAMLFHSMQFVYANHGLHSRPERQSRFLQRSPPQN